MRGGGAGAGDGPGASGVLWAWLGSKTVARGGVGGRGAHGDWHPSWISSAIIVTLPCWRASSQMHCSARSPLSPEGGTPQKSGIWLGIELKPTTL